MDHFPGLLSLVLVASLAAPGSSDCPSGCSCADEPLGRTLQCMESPLAQIPVDIPHDFTKIRIENCHLTELPPGSFSGVRSLGFLWLNFNEITLMNVRSLDGLGNLTELRLQGNKLSSIPWTAFQNTPRLKILDLKHNRLDVLPERALRHLPVLTYLDLSFNHLSVASRDVFLNWPLYRSTERTWSKEGVVSNVVLALHDNPWTCDCRLKGFVEFIRAVNPPIILMSSYLMCKSPASRVGQFFHEVQLKTCLKPNATSADANLTLPLGASATLRCLVKARPEPSIQWAYGLKVIRGFTATETQIDEDTFSSELSIPSLHLADRGTYTCSANNFIGNSSVGIRVDVSSSTAPLPPPVPILSPDENPFIDLRIAKQTVYGITLEWFAVTENPAETWYTIHFGKYDSPKRDMTYIGPGINSYSLENLLPVTKYEVCLGLRNHPPREGQCVVFVTGSDVSEMEQRERLIHIVVVVCAMVLAVPAGMYACTAEARAGGCAARCTGIWKRRRRQGGDMQEMERQGTFDSLQAASSDTLCRDSEKPKARGRGGSAAQLY